MPAASARYYFANEADAEAFSRQWQPTDLEERQRFAGSHQRHIQAPSFALRDLWKFYRAWARNKWSDRGSSGYVRGIPLRNRKASAASTASHRKKPRRSGAEFACWSKISVPTSN